MGTAIAVRRDYSSRELRRLATRVKDAAQARRLLAIAAVLNASSREEAAELGGMDRQTLRDWVIRFNEDGPDGLVNKSSPGAPGKLTEEHKAFLVRLVEEGPIPAVDGVVRWRACDLIMRLYEEFGVSVSDDTVYRALKDFGLLACERPAQGLQAECRRHGGVQKNFPARVAEVRAKLAPGTPVEIWFQDEMRVGQKNKLTYRWARKGSRPVPPTIKGPNRPIYSVRSAPNGAPAPPSCCRPAIPKLCSFTSMRSQPKSLPALTLFSSFDQAGGTAPRHSKLQPTSRSCSSRHARLNSTAKKISGNSCVRIGCQTE